MLTKTAATFLPHASVITGVTGAIAFARHCTVELPFTGTTGDDVMSIVYV